MTNKLSSPLFITGLWRSGTTLISRIMNNHDDMAVTYDLVHFLRFSYNKYHPIELESSVLRLVEDVAERISDRYQIKLSVDEVMEDVGGNYDYSVIYNSIMSNLLLKGTDKKIWGEKTNVAWSKIVDFFDMYPNGRVINIVRDPRAVLFSWKNFTIAPGNDYLDSIINSHNAMSKAIEYNDIYKDKKYITIIYEELIENPSSTMRKVCDKLKIEYSENMLEQAKFKDMHGKSWKSNSVDGKPPDGIYKNALSKWKDGLEDWETALCEKITGSLFEDFGYVESLDTCSQSVTNKMISEINKSSLASDGFIRFLITNQSFERYPSDPTNKKNW